MSKEQLLELLDMLVSRLARESMLLSPDPISYISDPYGIFDWMVAEKLLTPDEIDSVMVKHNESKKLGNAQG